MLYAVGLLLVLQQPSAVPQTPSPIAKAVVQPSEVAIQVGDTVRLSVSAQDSAGRPFPNTRPRLPESPSCRGPLPRSPLSLWS